MTEPVSGRRLRLGVLMLDTRFARLPGDAGHAATWPFEVRFHVVRGVDPAAVVGDLSPLLSRFVEAAQVLVDERVDAVTTTCGFLVLLQKELSARCAVPVLTSSLLQVPWVQSLLPPGRAVGILASSAQALTTAHLRAAGVSPTIQTRVAGFDPTSDFIRHMSEGRPTIDAQRQEADVLQVVDDLLVRWPEVGAIVSECANLSRHSAAIAKAFGLPVYDLRSLVAWWLSARCPPVFD